MRSNVCKGMLLFAVPVGLFVGALLITTYMQKPVEKENTALPNLVKPLIVIKKADRTLEVFDGDKLVKSYTVVLGFAPEGDKEKEGDGKTPEGDFYVFTKNPESRFHLSLGLSYPSIDDAKNGLARQLITRSEHDAIVTAIRDEKMPPQKTALGGEIYIHGGGVSNDWTWGCVAMKNEEVEELFNSIPVATKVTIRP